VRFSELINTTATYRGSFSHEGQDAIFLDVPAVAPNSFSIFWFGNPTFDHVVDFVRQSLRRDWLSTTFFFPRAKVRFEAEVVERVPSKREEEAIKTHAEGPDYLPRFVRYEVYDRNPKELKVPPNFASFGARFVIWAAISTPAQVTLGPRNEIGIFGHVDTLSALLESVSVLVEGTIKPDIPRGTILDTLKQAVDLGHRRWSTPWPAALT
jgi:hypothetical protein